MKKQILNIGKALNRVEQKQINGGGIFDLCAGTGTGGLDFLGYSDACLGRVANTRCTINHCIAECTGNGGGFWFF